MVKGYRQRENVDFFDIYSPVTKITSISVIIALSTLHGLVIHKIVIKIAFLNGE